MFAVSLVREVTIAARFFLVSLRVVYDIVSYFSTPILYLTIPPVREGTEQLPDFVLSVARPVLPLSFSCSTADTSKAISLASVVVKPTWQ